MLGHGTNVLATLRRLRRVIAGAAAPALVSSLLAGAACPAMSAPAPMAAHSAHASPAAQHLGHAAHDHHAHDSTSVPPVYPTGDCPHCLGGHVAGNTAAVNCEVGATASLAPTQVLPSDTLVLPIASYRPPAASAIPPLIRASPRASIASNSSVPLHIRHCALLI